jgi:hypothetical protein
MEAGRNDPGDWSCPISRSGPRRRVHDGVRGRVPRRRRARRRDHGVDGEPSVPGTPGRPGSRLGRGDRYSAPRAGPRTVCGSRYSLHGPDLDGMGRRRDQILFRRSRGHRVRSDAGGGLWTPTGRSGEAIRSRARPAGLARPRLRSSPGSQAGRSSWRASRAIPANQVSRSPRSGVKRRCWTPAEA